MKVLSSQTAGGILESYISASFEKFLIDEETCDMVRKVIQPTEITDDSIDVEMIKQVGIGGQYLTQPKTFQLCRTEFFLSELMNRKTYAGWRDDDKKTLVEVASEKVNGRLASYERPGIDSKVEADLSEFVKKRKNDK